jgi:hypothetical protein
LHWNSAICSTRNINSTFVAKSEFSDEEKSRLAIASNLSRQAELKQANVQSLREQIRLNLFRVASQTGQEQLMSAAVK